MGSSCSETRRRIAMISEHASPLADPGSVDSGGQNVYVAQVARHLARMGHKVDVFTRRDSQDLPDIVLWEDGVRVVHVPAGPPSFVPKEEFMPYMQAFTDFMVQFALRRGRPYDLVHAHFFMSALVASELKRILGLPYVVTYHALGKVRRIYQGENDAFPDTRFQIEARTMAEADRVIAECPQDETDMCQLYDADPQKLALIPCGFDPHQFWPIERSEARRQVGLPQDDFTILQLGRMVPRKGVENVVRGLARLVHDHGLPARLVIVGGGSHDPDPEITPEIGRLQQIAEEERVSDHVTFVGRRGRQALKYYYSAADVFVSTPWYEPFGITPVEAMACGTPVIGSEVGGIQYTVADEETGYLVPSKDPDALAERLAYLHQDRQTLERLGEQALQRANSLFTWERVSHAIANLYDEILANAAATRSIDITQLILAGNRQKDQIVRARSFQSNGNSASQRRERTVDQAGLNGASAERVVRQSFDRALQTLRRSQAELSSGIIALAQEITACLEAGNKVLVAGNGGSAAQAQHFAAEFTGRYKLDGRRGLPVLALTADSAYLTAWANDVAFDQVFARQVQSFAQPGDLFLALSTSGNSRNLVEACRTAADMEVRCMALLGRDGGELLGQIDLALVIPDNDTARIQEMHLLVLHTVCELVEAHIASGQSSLSFSTLAIQEPSSLMMGQGFNPDGGD